MLFMRKSTALPSAADALPGRAQAIPTATSHFVNGHNLKPPYPQGLEQAVFALGCFWGAERKFWELGDGIYTFSPEQRAAAEASKAAYAKALDAQRMGAITTEILDAPPFYFAEDYHQQYLAKNPHGYCGLGGTGVSCPIGLGAATA